MNTYQNPVWEGADPFVLLYNGTYYFYVSNDEGYRVLTSDDLVNWTDRGLCLNRTDVQGDRWFWAPEVTERNGKFYMAYTAEEHIAIAVADSPLGPFKQAHPRWLSERNAIDGSFFQDEDGQVYLYYVRFDGGNVIYGAKLSADLLTLDEEHEQRLIAAEAEWETRDCLVAEGPFMLKYNGKYYLTYSANHFRTPDYAIGCAVADSPLGPFTKCDSNPILKKNETIVGTGHHCFTTSKDGERLICVYHCHHSKTAIHPRMMCIDAAEFTADGTLVIHGPTFDEQTSIT